MKRSRGRKEAHSSVRAKRVGMSSVGQTTAVHSFDAPTLSRPIEASGIWPLDPKVIFLNHGSFGSCPRRILEFQQQMRERIERQPVQFFVGDLENLLDQARSALAGFLGAKADNLVFVPNATSGVNTVLRSLQFQAGDELLVTDHEYNACRNALDFVAERSGARVVVAKIPFPLKSAEQITDAVLSGVSSRTRLALLDHVTSQTGLILPIERLVGELAKHGIDALIDGAHAPGMIPLHLGQIGAAYYTGNCHKWICAPKGAGFLYVQRGRQHLIRPLSISHGANATRTDRSRFLIEFGWTGTWDPSAFLSVPEALRFVGSLRPGGWPEIMRQNHELVLAGRRILCQALNIGPPCPDQLLGSLASVPIPDAFHKPGRAGLPAGLDARHGVPTKLMSRGQVRMKQKVSSPQAPPSPLYSDPLHDQLVTEYGIEVPVIPWPAPPKRLLRISAQLYNSLDQYQFLADVLKTVFR